MVMHLVLGDGEMPKNELTAHLSDLWSKATEADDQYWFILQSKAEPTATDRALVKWLNDNGIYFSVISGDPEADDKLYDGAAETHPARSLTTTVLKLLQEKPEGDEPADVLALFVSDDPEAEEDRYVSEVAQIVMDAGFPVFALNDGLAELDLPEGATPAAAEPEEEPEPVKKAPAKKAAAKKAAAPRPPADEEEETGEITREFLGERSLDELKAMAANRGIDLPPRTRHATYIERILGEAGDEVEVEEEEVEEAVVATNGRGKDGVIVIVTGDGTIVTKPVTHELVQSILGEI